MKILFYCCEFAPEGKTGAIRPTKFVKYFEKNNIDVHVLTKYSENNIYIDLLNDLSVNVKNNIVRVKLKKFLPINDDGFWFTICSFLKLYKLVKENNYDYIFISVPVFLPLLNTYLIKKIFKTKYIIDYRDLWYCDPYDPKSVKDKILRYIGKKLEPLFMRNATLVNFISENMKDDQELAFGKISNSSVISTGFDKNDFNFEAVNISFDDDIQYFSHIGMLDWDMNITEIVDLIKEVKVDPKKKFLFVGGKNNLIKSELLRLNLLDRVVFFDTVSKSEAAKIINKSAGVFILGSDSPQRLNRKVFESIYLNSNIFYFGNLKSPTAGVLKSCGYQYVFDKSIPFDSVHKAFSSFYSNTNLRNAANYPSELSKYDKFNLAKEFIKKLQ